MEESTERAGAKVMHLRVPADLHAKVTAFATHSHRSVNGAALALLELGLVWSAETEAEIARRNPPADPTIHHR